MASLWPVLFVGISLVIIGLVLFALSSYKAARRFYVVKIRMPLIRKFRYRPKKPSRDSYRLPAHENGEPVS